MFLLELATLAFLEQKYYDLWDETLKREDDWAAIDACATWYSLFTAANLTAAVITLRPRVRSLDSLAGRALVEITHALREVENG